MSVIPDVGHNTQTSVHWQMLANSSYEFERSKGNSSQTHQNHFLFLFPGFIQRAGLLEKYTGGSDVKIGGSDRFIKF